MDYVHSAEKTWPMRHLEMKQAKKNIKYQASVKNAKTITLTENKLWR